MLCQLQVYNKVNQLYMYPHSFIFFPHIHHYSRLSRVSCGIQCMNAWSLRVQLFVTLWIVAHQTTQSMGFFRQEYWNGLPFPPSGDCTQQVLINYFIDSSVCMSITTSQFILSPFPTWYHKVCFLHLCLYEMQFQKEK